jgi:UDP-GlcNAc:undecaprenyl-phosphate GlcNAc-1-phosphate transferase
VINALLIPLILRIAHRFDWYDERNSRKIHTEDTPRLGGVGIFLSFTVATAFGISIIDLPFGTYTLGLTSIVMLGAGLVVMHGLGLYDDFVNLRAPFKFLVQLLSGLLVAFSGTTFGKVDLPWIGVVTLPPWLAIPITALWIVSIANAINLIDGADGLAAGVGLIIAVFVGSIAISQGGLLTGVFAFALVGSLAGFLVYNVPPARIFMGDGGSLALGYMLAVLPLVGLERIDVINGPVPPVPVLTVLTLLIIPIVDTTLAIIRRIGRGLPVHAPDREHIHHRLIDRGFRGRRLLVIVYSGAIVLGFIAASWYTLEKEWAALIMIATWVATIFVVVAIGPRQRTDRSSL